MSSQDRASQTARRSRPARRAGVVVPAAVLLAAAGAVLLAGCSDRGVSPTVDAPGGPPGAFQTAATCGACHPQHFDEWKRSMHAYGGVDPVMLAMAERAAQEGGDSIGQECRDCHSPALVRAEELAALGEPVDPADFTEDGISCDVCHSVQIVPPVSSIAFLKEVDPAAPKLGGIRNPVPNDVHESRFDSSYQTSVNCAPCHQVNLDNGSGLENTYQEWADSFLSGFGVECQDCHMPSYTGTAAEGGPVRQDVHRHGFVGVDYALEPYRGIDRAAQIADIAELLRNSVTMSVPSPPTAVTAGGTLAFSVDVFNDKTGHSIPSGTSWSREMWIEVRVTDASGTLYESGILAADGSLVEDADLAQFGSRVTDARGNRTFFSWQAAAIDESGLLPQGATRRADYAVAVPGSAAGPLDVSVRLLFRPMNPLILRDLDLERLLPVEIFEMAAAAFPVAVTP